MFDSFKNTFKRYKEPVYNGREGNGYQPLPQYEEIQVPEENAVYTVGTLNNGNVQLKVGYPTTVILTMDNAGVRHMIKLLKAAMIEDEDKTTDGETTV